MCTICGGPSARVEETLPADPLLHVVRFERDAGDRFVAWADDLGSPTATKLRDLSSRVGGGDLCVFAAVAAGSTTSIVARAPSNAVPLGASAVILAPALGLDCAAL